MAFTPKTAPFSGKINAVTLGTGDKAIVIGGQNAHGEHGHDEKQTQKQGQHPFQHCDYLQKCNQSIQKPLCIL